MRHCDPARRSTVPPSQPLLYGFGRRTVFHETSWKNAETILQQGFKAGTSDALYAGKAIYFTQAPGLTAGKVGHHDWVGRGCILECVVDLGNAVELHSHCHELTASHLSGWNCDSVWYSLQSGPEFVVYTPQKIRQVKVWEGCVLHGHQSHTCGVDSCSVQPREGVYNQVWFN
jgi:hypothetical protein